MNRIILLLMMSIGLITTGQAMDTVLLKAGSPLIKQMMDRRIPGSVDVLLYTLTPKGQFYLMCEEASGEGLGSAFRGDIERNPKTNLCDRLGLAALKKLREKSGFVLNLSEEYLLDRSYLYMDFRDPNSQKFTFITQLTSENYRSASVFNEARRLKKGKSKWVALASLLSAIANDRANNISVKTLPDDLKNPGGIWLLEHWFNGELQNQNWALEDSDTPLNPAFLENFKDIKKASNKS
jgi:hypothetical protein